jgi:DNA-binding CsgD family transcriptional regulator
VTAFYTSPDRSIRFAIRTRGDDETELEILARYRRGETPSQIADRMGMMRQDIHRIVQNILEQDLKASGENKDAVRSAYYPRRKSR